MSIPDLADVAATYKQALYSGGYPKQAVVKAYGVNENRASQLIRKARDAGLISEHEKGRPGFVATAASRRRTAVLDAAEAVAREWKTNLHSFELGDLLDDLVRAVDGA